MTRPSGQLVTFSDYTGFARRHLAWLAGFIAFGMLAGLAWSFTTPTQFSSTASVATTPVPVYVMRTTNELVPPEVTIDTDAQLLSSPRVRSAVADALGITRDGAADRLSVTATPSSRVLHLRVSSPSARRSATAANAAAAAFTEERRLAFGALRTAELRQLRSLIASKEAELARSQIQALLISPTDEDFAAVVSLRDRLSELEEARRQPSDVAQPAEPATVADHPNTEVPVVSGAAFGLLAGCLIGAVRDSRRKTKTKTNITQEPNTALASGRLPTTLAPKEYDYAL